MNLVSFSIKTKGAHNFARRLGTVFTRFGVSEAPTRQALYTIIDSLRQYNAEPTFFIPAVVLRRHPELITEIAHSGVEIGIHGYIHNDYRLLSESEQYEQTRQAIAVFEQTPISYRGFRNPYLGWTEESLHIFAALGFMYESNEAVIHDVIDLDQFTPLLRNGYEKSLELFQATTCTAYALRPHFEGALLRIPTSIPDDEMLFDRLRVTSPKRVGGIWCKVMQRVYELGGLYTLNLHPERGILCKRALDILLSYAHNQPLPVWVARLGDITQWWKERSRFRLNIIPQCADRWLVEASCTPQDAYAYTLYLDITEGLGTNRKEQMLRRSALVEQIEQLEAPLLRFGCWPNCSRAALAVSGDIDSVTIQDFFLRIIEVHQHV